jgi:tRNA G18 (ribose-2'-O)-methylase SpoU
MDLIPIQSLSDPRLAPYANLRDAELAQRADPLDAQAHQGLFIAEGELVLRRLIASPFAVHSVLTTPAQVERLRDALGRLPPQTPVFLAEQPVLNDIVGFNMHRGVLGIGRRGPALPLDRLLARPGPVVILEDLVNHDNLGGIFRNAAALGGPGVWIALSPRCADPLYRKSIRVSMGTALCVPFARLDSWPGGLRTIREAGFDIWGLTPSSQAQSIGEACRMAPDSRIALVLGSEGPGLTSATLDACSRLVCIPMRKADAEVDSLNVAMSLGIALHCLGDI